jgi:hypothetical protein
MLVALLGIGVLVPLLSELSAHPAPALSPLSATPAYANPASEEAQFIALTNQLRATKGLSQLTVSPEVTAVARRWAGQMAAAGAISHNSNLPNEVKLSWTKLGENVGVGPLVTNIQDAFIKSPTHYKNLVDPVWTHVGIGVVDSAGRIWVTVNFMQLPGRSATPAPVPAPAPRAATPRTPTRPAAPPPTTPRPVPVPATVPPRGAAARPAARGPDTSRAITLGIDQVRILDDQP